MRALMLFALCTVAGLASAQPPPLPPPGCQLPCCHCSSTTVFFYVDCYKCNISSIPVDLPRNTTHLSIDFSQIWLVPAGAVNYLPHLISISIQNARLRHDSFEPDTFARLNNLTSVSFDHNGFYNIPAELPISVIDLSMSNNNVFDLDALPKFQFLDTLNLGRNSIEHIGYNDFSDDNRFLRVLILGYNRITFIESRAFRNAAKLEQLYLDWNQLTDDSFSDSSFNGLVSLHNLTLQGNKIKSIPLLPPSLLTLDLSFTSIETLSPNAMQQLSKLQILTMNNIRLHTVDMHAFVGLSSLYMISLSNGEFAGDVLGRGVLADLTGLQTLVIYNSSISLIQSGAFEYNNNLLMLSAANNQLATLTKDVFRGEMQYVILGRNPWRCDCNLRWLKEHLDDGNKQPNVGDASLLTCDTPSKFKGKRFSELTSSDFVCN